MDRIRSDTTCPSTPHFNGFLDHRTSRGKATNGSWRRRNEKKPLPPRRNRCSGSGPGVLRLLALHSPPSCRRPTITLRCRPSRLRPLTPTRSRRLRRTGRPRSHPTRSPRRNPTPPSVGRHSHHTTRRSRCPPSPTTHLRSRRAAHCAERAAQPGRLRRSRRAPGCTTTRRTP